MGLIDKPEKRYHHIMVNFKLMQKWNIFLDIILMAWCKWDVTPMLMHWSYVFFALSHCDGYVITLLCLAVVSCSETVLILKLLVPLTNLSDPWLPPRTPGVASLSAGSVSQKIHVIMNAFDNHCLRREGRSHTNSSTNQKLGPLMLYKLRNTCREVQAVVVQYRLLNSLPPGSLPLMKRPISRCSHAVSLFHWPTCCTVRSVQQTITW